MNWQEEFLEMMFSIDHLKIDIEGAFKLKSKNIPNRIYKYRTCNSNSLKNLIDGTVWLGDPASMNDPYECTLFFDANVLRTQDAAKHLDDQVESLLDEVPPAQREILRSVMTNVANTSDEEFVKYLSGQIKQTLKFCSFSERVDSTLMWGHYAESHKGFCVEYDLKSVMPQNQTIRNLFPVIYKNSLFDITKIMAQIGRKEDFNNLYVIQAGIHKAADWEYEKEWRLMFHHRSPDESQAYIMPKASAVYLGSHISLTDAKKVLDICCSLGTPVFKMKHAVNEFKMTYGKVVVDDYRNIVVDEYSPNGRRFLDDYQTALDVTQASIESQKSKISNDSSCDDTWRKSCYACLQLFVEVKKSKLNNWLEKRLIDSVEHQKISHKLFEDAESIRQKIAAELW